MEERRIERISDAMRSSTEAEKKVLPFVSRCLDAMMDAAESIQPRMVSLFWALVLWDICVKNKVIVFIVFIAVVLLSFKNKTFGRKSQSN